MSSPDQPRHQPEQAHLSQRTLRIIEVTGALTWILGALAVLCGIGLMIAGYPAGALIVVGLLCVATGLSLPRVVRRGPNLDGPNGENR